MKLLVISSGRSEPHDASLSNHAADICFDNFQRKVTRPRFSAARTINKQLKSVAMSSTEVQSAAQDKTLLPPSAALLRELLESSRNLPNSSPDLGSIQLGLKEISKRASSLRKGTEDENDTKAHYLLANSGVNAEDIASDLQSLNFQQSLEPTILSSSEVDIDNYLRAKKEETILAAIEESVRTTARDFDHFLAQNVTVDWKVRKQHICEHFGLVPKSQFDDAKQSPSALGTRTWGRLSLGRYVLGPISGGEFSDVPAGAGSSAAAESVLTVQTRSRRHAEVVAELNRARLNDRSFPIASHFSDVTSSYGMDTRSQQLHDSWEILRSIVGEVDHHHPISERAYSKQYNADLASSDSIELRNRITKGSKTYLERQFFALIENEIAKHPQEAMLGGIPSVQNKIRAFLTLRFSKNGEWIKPNLEIVNNVPIWAMTYYLLRSGHLEEALEFTLQHERSFQKIERSFPQYIKAYVTSRDNRLSWELLERLHTEFNQHVRFLDENSDPYKYALYKIIGRCELSRKAFPEVVITAEDWLWVQLALTKEGDNDSSPIYERYSLQDLQRMIIQFGAKHFNPNKSNPGLYFQVLMLSGLFEWAVQYLYSFSQVDAVHFAIALTYYGLLSPIDDISTSTELLALDKEEKPHINFASLIGYYTRDFRRSEPALAVDYLVLLCMNDDLIGDRGKKHLKMCHEALKELVLETREFSTLLGDVLADGTRQPGAIEQRMKLIHLDNEKQYLHTITAQAAAKAGEDGRTADAILLYQLSEDYDTVVSIINQSLGETLSVVELGRSLSTLPEGAPLMLSATEDPAQLARNMMNIYSNNPAVLAKVSPRNRETCAALLKLVDGREAFAKGQWDVCLRYAESTGILSLSPNAGVGEVRRRAQQFSGLDESIARNVPTLLVMVMQCCVEISHHLNESEYSNNARATTLMDLKAQARNCMIYAGMIQYRMPREVYSQLTALESAM